VVLFTAHGTTKDEWAEYGDLAGALAERGLVVAVANWSQLDADQSTTGKVLRVVAEGRAVQSCAVTFAVNHAAEFGADPQRLVLMGQMYGGNMTSVTALSPRAAPVSGCVEKDRAWQPSGLLVWDGDWLLGMDLWDSFGSDAARIASALTPWSALPTAPPVPVVLAYSDAIAQSTGRCDAGTRPAWLSMRDPSGTMRRQLLAVDAFADDCIDLGDEARAMAAAMTAADLPASVLELTGATTTEEGLDPADQAALVDAAAGLAGGSCGSEARESCPSP
jgi:acetyl esterase/lipase